MNKEINFESKEQIKKPKEMNQMKENEKNVINKKNKKRKLLICFIIWAIIFIIVISAITLFIIVSLKKTKENNKEIKKEGNENIKEKDENIINTEDDDMNYFLQVSKKNNTITAIYLLEEGKETILFNPEKIDLSEKNYKIEILTRNNDEENSSSNTRILEEINYKYIPTSSGKFEFLISFNVLLTTVSELFKGCRNLVEIDLSNLESENIKDLNSTFENCENLEIANLSLKNGTNVNSMANSFSGCSNLKEVDLTNLKPKYNISLQFMFKDCINLNYVDLSNFNSFNFQGLFLGCINLKIYDISIFNSNKNNSNSNVSLSDILDSIREEINLTCEIGANEKCKRCQNGLLNAQYCNECNEGYYLPYLKNRKECLKCNDNCLICSGSVTSPYCYKCEERYYSYKGICKKICEIGTGDKCKSCDIRKQHLCGALIKNIIYLKMINHNARYVI